MQQTVMKKLLFKHWPLMGALILLLVMGALLLGRKKDMGKDSLLSNVVPGEGLKMKNIHFTQEDPEDRVKWVLDAKEVEYSPTRQFFIFRDFILKLEPLDRPSIELEGKRGDFDKETGEINLRGDLRGHTADGYHIFTDHLLFHRKAGLLHTEEPVKIAGPTFSISGRGLRVNLEKESLKVMSQVTTLIHKEFLL